MSSPTLLRWVHDLLIACHGWSGADGKARCIHAHAHIVIDSETIQSERRSPSPALHRVPSRLEELSWCLLLFASREFITVAPAAIWPECVCMCVCIDGMRERRRNRDGGERFLCLGRGCY